MSQHPSDDDLRAALSAAAIHATPGPDCPEPARLWELAEGNVDETVLDHVSVCPSCQEAVRLGRVLVSEHAGDAKVVELQPAANSSRWGFAVLGAALAAGIIGVIVLRPPVEAPDVDVIRGELAVPLRSATPDAIPRSAAELRWTEGPEGTVYDVRVLDEQLLPVAEVVGLQVPHWTIPAERLQHLPTPTSLQWRVTARTPEGRRLSSPTWPVRIEAR